MSRFKSSIESGIQNANNARRNINQINSIFDELNKEVKSHSKGEVSFVRVPATFLLALTRAASDKEPNNKFGSLSLRNSTGVQETVAKWEEGPDGYPFIVEYNGDRNDCWDEESLVGILNEIVSAGSFWLTVRKLASK